MSIASRMVRSPSVERRSPAQVPRIGAIGLLAALGFSVLGFFMLGGSARAADSGTGAPPVAVVVHNGDPVFGLDVAVDDQVRARRVPPGHEVSLVVDAGTHVIDVVPGVLPGLSSARGLPVPPPVHGTVTADGRTLVVFATAASMTVTSGAETALTGSASPGLEIAPAHPLIRWHAPASLGAIVLATLCLAAVTSGVIAHLIIGRTRVRDERIRLRMQQLALRSLNDLPPLTIGVAARRGATDRGGTPTSPGPPKLKSARPRRPRAEVSGDEVGRVEVVRGGRVGPSLSRRTPRSPSGAAEMDVGASVDVGTALDLDQSKSPNLALL